MLGLKVNELRTIEWYTLVKRAKGRTNYNRFSYKKYFPWHIQSRLRTPAGTPRKTASAFFQLKLGHGYLKSYLYRFNYTSNDKCRCGRTETTEHLLLTCTEYSHARRHFKDRLEGDITLQILLHTKVAIEATLAFLQETQISTREWHLRRNEESEGEESQED